MNKIKEHFAQCDRSTGDVRRVLTKTDGTVRLVTPHGYIEITQHPKGGLLVRNMSNAGGVMTVLPEAANAVRVTTTCALEEKTHAEAVAIHETWVENEKFWKTKGGKRGH